MFLQIYVDNKALYETVWSFKILLALHKSLLDIAQLKTWAIPKILSVYLYEKTAWCYFKNKNNNAHVSRLSFALDEIIP